MSQVFGYDPICSPDGHALVKSGLVDGRRRGDDGLRWTRTVNRVNDALMGRRRPAFHRRIAVVRELQYRNNGIGRR